MPILVMGFGLGIWLLQRQTHLPSVYWLLLPLVAITLCIFALYRLRDWIDPARVSRILIPIFAIPCGFAWALFHAHGHPVPPPADLRAERAIEGRIVSLPLTSAEATRFLFEFHDSDDDIRKRLRVSWYGSAPELRPGEVWRLSLRLRAPRGFMNPGGFDYEGWLRQQGVWAVATVRPGESNHRITQAQGLTGSVDRLRQHVVRGMSGDDAQPLRFGGVLMALAVGHRAHIPDEHWDVFLATGTNHLMAISGLHIGLMAGLGYLLVNGLWRRLPRMALRLPAQRAGALAAVITGALYAALAGFSIPTQRALVMLCVVMLALWLGRNGQPWRVLSLALLAVLLWDPLSLLAAGFWLSFGAVAVILLSVTGRLRPPTGWRALVRIQVVVAVGLSPLLLAHFNHTSLVAPLANLLAVPWVGFLVVPLTLLSAAMQWLHPATGLFLAGLADGLIGLIWPWLEWLAGLPFARWYTVRPEWALGLAALGIALWLLPRGLPGRALAPVLCLPLFWPQAPELPEGGLRLTLLDVGQGLAAVVQTRHHVLVYDTGPRFPSGFDTGDAVVVPYLRQQGVFRVDRLVISHGDNDHAGGARSLLEQMTVKSVQGRWAEGPDAQGFSHEAMSCERGQQWQWDGVEFRILHPPPHWGDDNISSCVLQVSGPGGRVLLPGDVEGLGEAVLLAYDRGGLQSDVLVLPHHGARQGTSDPLLEAVSPRLALVAAGFQSRFGHPHEDVRERLAKQGIPLRETAVEGAIRVDLLPGEALYSPPGWRLAARRYWHGR